MVNRKVTNKEYSNHDKYIDDIVKTMWAIIKDNLTSPNVVATAKTLKGSDDIQTAYNVFEYVRKIVPYKNDPDGVERLTAPKHLISGTKYGEDCDGMVMLCVALLLLNGIDCRIKTIAWRKFNYTHVVLDAKINNKWIEIDCTMKNGFDVKNRTVIRTKKYERNFDMNGIIETLNDNTGGCGCKKKSSKPTNQNINVNPIILGNDFSQYMKDLTTNSGEGKHFVDSKEIIKEIPIEKKVYVPIKENEKYLIDSASAVAQKKANEYQKPVKALATKNGTYVYKTGF